MPEVDETAPPVTHFGDLWRLGRHRLLCGDALRFASYERLMTVERAKMIFTDPPYNVPIDGHVCGLGSVKHAEFAMASGEMSEREFAVFLKTALRIMARYSSDGALHFVCMDWRHAFELMCAARGIYSELKNLCVWNKTNGGMGSLYRSKHELVFVFKNGTAPHINNVALGRYGRYRTNVWDYAGANALGAGREDALAMHPTVKPVALVADAIKDCSQRGNIVLDAFGGSRDVPNPIGIKPEGDKLVRMEAQTPRIEAGQVFLPKDAPWLGNFLDELLAFPKGRHDDQVDSVSQFLNWVSRRQHSTSAGGGAILIELEDPGAPYWG